MGDHEGYRSLERPAHAELVIKKSRFLTFAGPAADEEAALAYLAEAQKAVPDARHHCYAYVTGFPQLVIRMSDDGEPSGTAGKPILDVILREELQNTMVVVSRLFGGILLGAAGLVRAYAGAAKAGIDAAGIAEYRRHQRWTLTCDYAAFPKVQHLFETRGVRHEPIQFDAQVKLEVMLDKDAAEDVVYETNEILHGQGVWEQLESVFLPIRSG